MAWSLENKPQQIYVYIIYIIIYIMGCIEYDPVFIGPRLSTASVQYIYIYIYIYDIINELIGAGECGHKPRVIFLVNATDWFLEFNIKATQCHFTTYVPGH